MAALVFLVLILAMVGDSDATWCICNPNQSPSALQKTLDYACGAGADCSPILQNGACYNPNTIVAHCCYAANSYYQIKGQAIGSCDFTGTAMTTSADPSTGGCTYPSTPSAAGTSSSTNRTTTPPGSFTPGSGSTFTPNSGIGGLGPSGNSFDGSDGGFLPMAKMSSLLLTIILIALVWLRI